MATAEGDALARAQAVADADYRWRHENPDLWELVVGWAIEAGRQGREFSTKELMERLRSKDRTDRSGRTMRINNDRTALWARLLVMEHPWLKGLIIVKPSMFDSIPLRW